MKFPVSPLMEYSESIAKAYDLKSSGSMLLGEIVHNIISGKIDPRGHLVSKWMVEFTNRFKADQQNVTGLIREIKDNE